MAVLLLACAAGGAGTAIALEVPSPAVRQWPPKQGSFDSSSQKARLAATDEQLPLASAVRFWTATTGCIATKIGERRFLTAAHCVDDLSIGARLQLTHRMDGRPAAPGARLAAVVTAIHVHPSYGFNQGLDLALIDLAQETNRVPVLKVDTIDASPLEAGAKAHLIGSGCDRVLVDLDPAQQVELVAAPRESSPSGSAWDDWFERFIVSFTPSALACPGNSGAPAFHWRSGQWWLVGVNKGIERNQGSTAITRIAPALPWLSALSPSPAHRT